MTDLPIIFSAPMVLALLAGRKTQTRRMAWSEAWQRYPKRGTMNTRPRRCSRGDEGASRVTLPSPWQKVRPGDRLWVRENFAVVPASAYRHSDGVWQTVNPEFRNDAAIYAAGWDRSIPKWRPSIHLPRWASRLTLIVTKTKIERVQAICREDEIAEGTPDGMFFDALWSSIHGADGWDANPEVVALTFRVVKDNIDRIKEAA